MLALAETLQPVLAHLDQLEKVAGSECSQLTCTGALTCVLDLLAARDTLMRLPELTRWRGVLTDSPLRGVLDDCEALGLTSGSQAASLLRYVWLASIVEAATIADPALATFDGKAQDELVAEFRELDRRQISVAATRVQRLCAERLMAARDRHPDESELVVKESLRKRGHQPLRELVPRASNVLMALKPCWAMSPLVVSQLLPSQAIFDVVIFDEASQVPPWDAIPSISRGRTVVVAGDRKQLPPTTFFLSAEDGAAEEELDWNDSRLATTDLESVLDLMTAILPAPQGTRTLGWHYRSKDERLIAFSNASFYDNSLTTFPGVDSDPCVTLVRVAADAVPGRQESGSAESPASCRSSLSTPACGLPNRSGSSRWASSTPSVSARRCVKSTTRRSPRSTTCTPTSSSSSRPRARPGRSEGRHYPDRGLWQDRRRSHAVPLRPPQQRRRRAAPERRRDARQAKADRG